MNAIRNRKRKEGKGTKKVQKRTTRTRSKQKRKHLNCWHYGVSTGLLGTPDFLLLTLMVLLILVLTFMVLYPPAPSPLPDDPRARTSAARLRPPACRYSRCGARSLRRRGSIPVRIARRCAHARARSQAPRGQAFLPLRRDRGSRQLQRAGVRGPGSSLPCRRSRGPVSHGISVGFETL